MLEAHSKPASHFERLTKEALRRKRPKAHGHRSYSPADDSNSPATNLEVNNAAGILRLSRVAKRGFDIIAAVTGLFIFSPTFLLAAITIKLISAGSVLRTKIRRGFKSEHFSVIEFQIANNNEEIISRMLRSTGTDRLPQLINVLRGEMSIVGPDPFMVISPRDFEQQISSILQTVKPGMTGWARVNGSWGDSNLHATQQRLDLDQFYMERWSLLFDIKIIFMTVLSALAYPQTPSDPT
jgi:lipopolysaccharide/colanic/teichoic acid biosynthesis glycosyltransferase